MVELTPEEESSLKELVDACRSDDNVADFIKNRLFNELSHTEKSKDFDGDTRVYHDGFTIQNQVYQSLVTKGMLSGYRNGLVFRYQSLTSEGRCYFDMQRAAKRAELKIKWGNRVWQIIIAAIGVLLSIIAGVITNLCFN